MNIFRKILQAFESKNIVITLESIIRTKSGREKPIHAYDWAFRDHIVRFLSSYRRIYIISNMDYAETIGEESVREIAHKAVESIRNHTKASVEYMSSRPIKTNNPMRMPDTGMVDCFLNCDSLRPSDVTFVGHSDESRECAARLGCIYYNVCEVSRITEKTL